MVEEHARKRLAEEVTRLDKKFGHKTGGLGSDIYHLNVVPTGVLALDYALQIGGWPLGHAVEVYGPPDIGKTSSIGYNAIASAQRQGKLCGIIALEPGFDQDWAVKNGVNPEMVAIARPSTGEDAFTILHEWVTGDLIDFILFDSIGAVLKATETGAEGKPMQGGQSSLITWGVKRIMQPLWKSNKTVIFLNQIRDDMNARYAGQVDSPGGHALKHCVSIRVQLRPGRERYYEGSGDDAVLVGKQLIAVVKRNKLAEGTDIRAVFDFYQKDTDDHSVGVDAFADITNTCTKAGIITRSGGWYQHPFFPDGKLQGKVKIAAFLEENPEIADQLREEVLHSIAGKPSDEDEQETTSD